MDQVCQDAIELASTLAAESAKVQNRVERDESAQLARMMDDPAGKAFTLVMVDRVFRSHAPHLQANRLREYLKQFGMPRYLPTTQKILMGTGALASRIAPGPVMKAMENELRRSSARVILAGEKQELQQYLQSRKAAGTRVNLNQLGEAVLGEQEARHRMEMVLSHLADPAVDYISVKISAIYSQINIIDWDNTLTTIKDRLRSLYHAAALSPSPSTPGEGRGEGDFERKTTLDTPNHPHPNPLPEYRERGQRPTDSRPPSKFINLDMEEYRDLEMTLAAFMQVLDEDEFQQARAGIVLQAYVPDSWHAQQRLTAWAKERVAKGGKPIKLRLVKGANLAMETVEAELHGWNIAPYTKKSDTDANYRRMMEFGCQPENAAAVRLGVASHNLFDISLALVLREKLGVADFVELEMLEGMANHQARAVQQKAGGLLVYAPVVQRQDFLSAMAYLVRRLDENTSPENFLHDLFGLKPGSPAWDRQKDRFVAGWENRATAPADSHRGSPKLFPPDDKFHNASDTDWTQRTKRCTLNKALKTWSPAQLPALPSVETVLTTAQSGQAGWAALGYGPRCDILRRCADVMEADRFNTIAQMIHEGKKAAAEADGEVSEAIDFARYLAATAAPLPAVKATPLGIVVITPPWNFPYAIPCGGLLAALVAGNSVILKPAPETVGVAYKLAQQLWEAGIPRDALQFFPCPDGEIGKSLITDPRVNAVVLTGAYETAQMFLGWRPTLKLYAETSGKNAIIITGQSDRDLAIKDLVKSAFGHAGQKCSAASLAILEAEVYDDPAFRRALLDAAASLQVGPATDLGSVVTPVIREPSPNLLRALTTLDDGEEWLLQPKGNPNDPSLWSPGIKLGVKHRGWFHRTECFGPVLGLMRATSLQEAISFQNDTAYGLTGGIHSLDDNEIDYWKQHVQVGNAYINRPITGAIVQRQPFGGWKKSCIGPGSKAGGPNYAMLFATLEDATESTPDYQKWWDEYFSIEHDPSNLQSESNHLRYQPCRGVILRLENENAEVLERARLAARVCGVPLHVSIATQESEETLITRLPALVENAEFLRTIATPGPALLSAAYEAGLNWLNAPLLACGRHELPRWLREQAISQTRHRYGLLSETNAHHNGVSYGN